MLAVQGPEARELLAPVLADAAAVGRFHVSPVTYAGGAEGWAAGTGYTGEDGVELHVPAAAATAVWRAILDAGIVPAGLGARDTLRLEAGLPLHGHELGDGDHAAPSRVGLGRALRQGRLPRPRCAGRRAASSASPAGSAGWSSTGARSRAGVRGARAADDRVGEVTSGNFSPTLERGIALAFVPPDVAVGDALDIDIRGRHAPATVTELPFVRR